MNDLYNWFIPSRADWINAHQDKDILRDMAIQFYDKLDSLPMLLLIIAAGIGILGAILYYYVINN